VRTRLPVEPISDISATELARQMATRLGGKPKSYERAIYRARLGAGCAPTPPTR
jgi:hypothetical protein